MNTEAFELSAKTGDGLPPPPQPGSSISKPGGKSVKKTDHKTIIQE